MAFIVASEAGESLINFFDLTGDYHDAFGAVINLKERVTQAKVAEYLEKYSQHFSDVQIGFLFFRDVPKSIVDSLDLPHEKLHIVPYRSQTH